MAWQIPKWCAAPEAQDSHTVVIMEKKGSNPQRLEVPANAPAYVLRTPGSNDARDEAEPASTWHARLLRNASGKCFIEDLSSATGSFMNGKRLEPKKAYPWEAGMVVVLGCTPNEYKATLEMGTIKPQLSHQSTSKPAPSSETTPAETPLRTLATGSREPACTGVKRQRDWRGDEPKAKKQITTTSAGQGDKAQLTDGTRIGCKSSTGCRGRNTNSTTPTPHNQSSVSASKAGVGQKCDKCDGPHPTDACPYFKKAREKHKDAWVNLGNTKSLQMMGQSGGKFILRGGRPVRQPGDGSCLFHSLCYGLNILSRASNSLSGGMSPGRYVAGQLRKELANFIQRNPRVEISGDTIEEWVRWDANASVQAYARRMAHGGHWGGGIEMAVCSLLKKVNVHVYEPKRGGAFERISRFDSPQRTKNTIHVLYQGGVHYDALVIPQHA